MALTPGALARAAEPVEPNGGRLVTPAELGFSGTRAEIRSQAAEILPPGTWHGPDDEVLAAVRRAAEQAPRFQLEPDPFSLGSKAAAAFRRATSEGPRKEPASAREPEIVPDELDHGGSGIPMPSGLQVPYECRTSGHRIKLFYAYPVGYQSSEPWEALKPWTSISRANTKFALESALTSSEDRMTTLYVDCFPPGHTLAGYPTVTQLKIPPPHTTSELWHSLNVWLPSPENQQAIRNLVFYVASDPDDKAGYAQTFNHSSNAGLRSREAASRWNQSTLSAVIFQPYWTHHTVVHELLHTFGAVNDWTPKSLGGSGVGHCTFAWDVMCYADGGPYADLFPNWLCPNANTPFSVPLDCLKSIYFRSDHGDGGYFDSWLDGHWNTIGAENRFVKSTPPWDYSVPCDSC